MNIAEALVDAAIAAVIETKPGVFAFDATRFAALRAALEANSSGPEFHAIVVEMCTLGVFLQKKPAHAPLAQALLTMLDQVAAPEAARLKGKQVAIATARVDAAGAKFSAFVGSGPQQLPDTGARVARLELPRTIRA
ncbi:MAG: hypothetical protein JNK82_39950 [Myxococcaceae bacterium]|nr:hypothetical protein [Myxococcaceae bacterium]